MMKLKSNQTRTYDGDGYKKRAACLCFRSETEEEVSPPVCLPGRARLTLAPIFYLLQIDGVLIAAVFYINFFFFFF